MQLDLAATVSAISLCLTLSASAAPTESDSTEIAFVANAEAGTVALVDIASRSIVGEPSDSGPAPQEASIRRPPAIARFL